MTSIPKSIHFVWLGGAPLPDYARANIAKCRELHPDFRIEVWSEDRLDFDARFPKAAYELRQWSRASNYFRMQVLERHGGIYLDVDMETVRPFDPLLSDAAFLGFQLPDFGPSSVNGAIIGSQPGHWFVRSVRRRLAEQMTGAEPVDPSTGPGAVTNVLIERGLTAVSPAKTYVDDVAIYPTRAFYPYHWSEPRDTLTVSPDTFAIHHWARSWVPRRTRLVGAADWARRNVPLYWRIEEATSRLRRSHVVLHPLSTFLARRFDLKHRPNKAPSDSAEIR